MLNRQAYSSWATTASSLLALTYGLDRALSRRRDGMGWTLSAIAAPIAAAGLAYWTKSLIDEARR